MKWKAIREVVTRNWKEKLLSVVLALLFWFMIKAQANRSALPFGNDRIPRAARM
ncbi:MAG: hypothetical protein U0984_15510 [Prosthecobacter sp.]|nr:hypothetical protein [Prosthecobacter sp.]